MWMIPQFFVLGHSMAAFTQLALSTNCYKLASLLKSIQHAFMLCYHLVSISNPCKRYKFSWNHLVVCKLPNPIDESKELPSFEVVQGRGCDIRELSYTFSSYFFIVHVLLWIEAGIYYQLFWTYFFILLLTQIHFFLSQSTYLLLCRLPTSTLASQYSCDHVHDFVEI